MADERIPDRIHADPVARFPRGEAVYYRDLDSIGDTRRVIDMLVGDTQRIDVYAQRGFAIPQQIPD